MNTGSQIQSTSQGDMGAITAWLRQNTIPLQHVEAGHGFDDLQPLKRMLAGVRIVGLGEATHGTREFFQIKHRLLEFLVAEMGFNAFALEASYAACQPINDFVLHGRGDRATVLTNQGYVPWDSEEFAEMLDWMRATNRGVPDEKKVSFHGVDLWRNEIGRQAVLAYLRRVAPAEVGAAEALFEVLAREEEKWPRRIDEEAKQTLRAVQPQLEELIAHLTANKEAYARSSSLAEFDHALQCAQVMKQWVAANTAEVPQQSRSPFMAENLMWLIDHGRPDSKYVVWAQWAPTNGRGLAIRVPPAREVQTGILRLRLRVRPGGFPDQGAAIPDRAGRSQSDHAAARARGIIAAAPGSHEHRQPDPRSARADRRSGGRALAADAAARAYCELGLPRWVPVQR